MKHKKIEKLIHKLLDREVGTEEKRLLQHHLSQCEECRQFHQEMVQTEQALEGLIEFYPRHGFNDRILKRLGFRQRVLWKKIAPVFVSAWVASLLALILSSWPTRLMNQGVTSVPAIVRFVDKIGFLVSAVSHLLMPFAKASVTGVYPIIGLTFSIFIFYFLGKTLQKEAKCKV